MDKKAIQDLLVIHAGDEEQKVRANIVQALRLILAGIASKEMRHEHALRSVATAMGFLAARCYRESARAAEQSITGVALSAVKSHVTAGDLLRGVDALAD